MRISSTSAARVLAVGVCAGLLVGFEPTALAAGPRAYQDSACSGPATAVTYRPGTDAPVLRDDTATVASGDTRRIDVLGNDTVAAGHQLSLVSVSEPLRGLACANADGSIQYIALPTTHSYTETFRYAVTDGEYYRTANVIVSVIADKAVVPVVTRKSTKRHRATMTFTNTNARDIKVLGGDRHKKRPALRRVVHAGHTTTVHTRLHHFSYVVMVRTSGFGWTPVNLGTLNSRTGKVHSHDFNPAGLRGRSGGWRLS